MTDTVRQDKDANATLDYKFAWTAWLASATIASSQVFEPTSTLTLTSIANSTQFANVVIAGGTEGVTYNVINRIKTNTDLIEDKVLQLTIINTPSGSHTFTEETGTGSATATVWLSVVDANGYHDSHLFANSWHQADTATKEKSLIWATRLMTEYFIFEGVKENKDNALEWPRIGATDRAGWSIDSDVIPQELKNATAELARHLIDEDRTLLAEDATSGFKFMQAGSLKLAIDHGDRKPVIPAYISRMMSFATKAGGGFRWIARV